MEGILIMDKPAGFTSFDVVAVVRRLSHQRKIGHTGTLDPIATGVLPLLLGGATRAASLLPDTDKEYEAEFRLGTATDTQDNTGRVTAQSGKHASLIQLEEALTHFTGKIQQLPPMYSAVSVNGRRLYEMARAGLEVEREKRFVTIKELELLSFDQEAQSGKLRVACTGGTYIRTLLHDVGEMLGTYGMMTALRRTRASGFTLADSVTLEQAKGMSAEGSLQARVLAVEHLFEGFPSVTVTIPQSVRFGNGGELSLARLTLPAVDEGQRLRVFSPLGEFLGLGEVSLCKEELRVVRVFHRHNAL